MATISFATKKPTTQTNVEQPKTETQAVAPAPTMAVSTSFQSPQLSGEFTRADMAIPYLSLGQETGDLTDEHPEWIGSWIFDKGICLGTEIRVIVCQLSKRYEEDLPYGSQDIPRRYDHKAEADADGVTVRDVADIDLLIETKELAEQATFSHGGLNYIATRYTVRSSAYGATVKFLLKDWAGWLKSDFKAGFYKFIATKRTGQKGSWFAPSIKADGSTTQELRNCIPQ